MIPLVDLKANYEACRKEIDEAMARTLGRGDFILGDELKKFEVEFAEYCGTRTCIGLASGTDALILALKALGVGPGDEVITVANTWASTVFAITLVGATPVFADIDPATYLIRPDEVQKAITSKTRAILPVHLYGQSADMDALSAIARENKLWLIEDAAQAHGATWNGAKRAGSFGHIGCFSFYPGKNLGAYGDGGAVTTSDPEIARQIRLLRNMGQEQRHHHEIVGTNSRLDSFQAGILRVKLKYLEDGNEKRRQAALRYRKLLEPLSIRLPFEHGRGLHAYHLFVIEVDERDRVVEFLNRNGVGAQVHYPKPVHLQPCYASLKTRALPTTEKVAGRILSLPIFPEITEAQQQEVARVLAQALTKSEAVKLS